MLDKIPIQKGKFGEAVNLHPDDCNCSRCIRLREWRESQC